MVESLGYTYDKKSLEEKAAILVDKLDLGKIVITLGPEGMALMDREGSGKLEVIPTVAQEVFDVSGAGDTTISLLTAGLLAGGTLTEAAWIGNCGAGVVVAKKGTATVNMEELTVFFKRLVDRYA
jgi:bifunctional ADP-heptose synthase (sugar kinase/adenylyltransferase)